MSAEDQNLPVGFSYIETLGRGGMGVVYLAYESKLQRYVALKMLDSRRRQHPKALERFLNEARAAARLSNPGIVQLFEVGSHNGEAWYSMEHVSGGDLAEHLFRNGGSLDWRTAVSLCLKIAQALSFAHSRGVAHRDIKPSNVLLTEAGEPKLTDFGLAWMVGQELQELTATGEILGTLAYLAPEYVNGSRREIDARRADLYSVGALLYHLIAGRPPFDAEHPGQLLRVIAKEPAPRLQDIPNIEVPPRSVIELCERCLEKNPAHRFFTADDLVDALHGVLEGRSTTLRLRWRRRHAWWLSAACVALVAAVALRESSWRQDQQADHAVNAVQGSVLAVLPAEAKGHSSTEEVLSRGFGDELIATLNRMTVLPVVAPGSVRSASAQASDPTVIGGRVGATCVVITSIQQWGDQIRTTVQLIRVSDGTVLWASTYDRRETNLLNLQTDIATDVALHLGAKLDDRRAVRMAGTSSARPEAQRLLLDAHFLVTDASSSVAQLDRAENLLLKAISIDPSLAIAHARLSSLHSLKYHWSNDRSEKRLEQALRSAQEALRLNPALAEGKLALAQYYTRGSRDFASAQRYLEETLAEMPTSSEALEALAQIERRGGHFDAAAKHYQSAVLLDPLNAILAYNAADTSLRLRDYNRASDILEAALARIPGHVALRKLRGDLYVAWKGDLGPMREDLATRDPTQPTPEFYLRDKVQLLVLENKLPEAIEAVDRSSFDKVEGQSVYLSKLGWIATLRLIAGDKLRAREYAEKALPIVSRELELRPNDARVILHAAELYACLGDLNAARQVGLRTVTVGDPSCADAFDRGFFLRSLAIVFSAAGDVDLASILLQQLLAEANQSSRAYVRLHPALSRFSSEVENSNSHSL